MKQEYSGWSDVRKLAKTLGYSWFGAKRRGLNSIIKDFK